MKNLYFRHIPMRMNEFSFLVLSDIHFGTHAEHIDFALPGTRLNGHTGYSTSMKSHLIQVVRESGVKIEAILVPGDLTSAACPGEFLGCWSIIEEIADELGIDKNQIFHTYGNHDTNWRISKLGEPSPGLQSDSNYSDIAAVVGSVFCKASSNLIPGPVTGSGVFCSDQIELFIANTGYYCTNEQEIKHGKLGEIQLKWLEAKLQSQADTNKWRLLMIHHHPFNSPYPCPQHDISFLEEGDALVNIIGKSQVDFVCHGHRHHPVLRTRIENSWKIPCTFFCAGSVAVNAYYRAAGNIKNMFHIVTLNERHPKTKGALGRVATYGFTISKGWLPLETTPDTDLDATLHFGSVAPLADRQSFIKELVEAHLTNESDGICYLPVWNNLPPDLKYIRYKETAELLQFEVGEKGLQLFRNYPQDPVILK